jgi:isopenicillin N synthase-like dioxygenase
VNIGDDVYKSVRPRPNVIVVNIGDMLSRITNYTLKATKHRVLDIGVDRYSSPFFFEPRYAAEIPTILNEGLEMESSEAEKLVYGDWLIEKMREFAEYKHF